MTGNKTGDRTANDYEALAVDELGRADQATSRDGWGYHLARAQVYATLAHAAATGAKA